MKNKKPKQKGFKRWFFGLGKEFNRISWTPKKKVLFNFAMITIVVTILILVFLGIDYLIFNII